uniref:Uncharacterized protein n=1 Tax=Panagrolaimus sp. PS1159 TaxID=55785 RepID=A0AC35GVZ3_9BILA
MRGRAVQKATQYMFVHVLLLEMIEASTGKDLKTTKAKFVKLIEVIQSKEAAKTVKETKGKETKGKQQKKAGKGLKV